MSAARFRNSFRGRGAAAWFFVLFFVVLLWFVVGVSFLDDDTSSLEDQDPLEISAGDRPDSDTATVPNETVGGGDDQTATNVAAEPETPPSEELLTEEPLTEEPVTVGDDQPSVAATEPPAATAAPTVESAPTGDAAAAGTYVLSEGSALAALEAVVERPESAGGALTIDPDGTVRGAFTLIYWDTLTLTNTDGKVESSTSAKSTAEVTVVPAVLVETDAGLVFETVVTEIIVVDHPDGRITRPIELPVTGWVDPEAGLLELALTGDTAAVEFRRTPAS